jgi:hypothetical protein
MERAQSWQIDSSDRLNLQFAVNKNQANKPELIQNVVRKEQLESQYL